MSDDKQENTDSFHDAVEETTAGEADTAAATEGSESVASDSPKKDKTGHGDMDAMDSADGTTHMAADSPVQEDDKKHNNDNDHDEDIAFEPVSLATLNSSTEDEPIEPAPTAVASALVTHDDAPIGESTESFEQNDELKEADRELEAKLEMLAVDDDGTPKEEPHLQSPIRLVPPALPVRSPKANKVTLAPVLPPRDGHPGSPPPVPARDEDAQEPPILPKRHPHDDPNHIFKAAAALEPPPLPPQLTHSQKQNHRSTISSWFKSSNRSSTSLSQRSEVEYDENYDLLLSRLDENDEDLSSKDEISRAQISSNQDTLKSSFADKLSQMESNSVDQSQSMEDAELKIDWHFWTTVVNDYASVVKSDPSALAKQISHGIPEQIRGIVWQLVSNSNPQEFEDQYETLKSQDSQFEKAIQKDLQRTSFIADLGVHNESLYNVIKAYSNMDTEVGYTQGMAFITVPLLINMSEIEAFSLLHKLMYSYNARSLYLPEMPGLLLNLYQFDRLVEDLLPNLHNHFQRQGIRSSMFATQWFLTFFAYKFPLEFVLRIFDLIITEGVESILKFAVTLVQRNEETLLTLKFDELLSFLKDNLFDIYRRTPVGDDDDQSQVEKSGFITAESYNVDTFVEEATNVKLLPITIKRYSTEWDEIHREEKERREEVDQLKLRNNQLRKEIRTVEASYTILNREHVQIANEMIKGRMKFAELEDANKDLLEQNDNLRALVKQLQENPISENVPVPAAFEADLKRTMDRNLEVMSQNQELEDQVQGLLQEVEDLNAKLRSYDDTPTSPVESSSPTKTHGGWSKMKLFK